ncbi:hypothetical protein [Marinomonas sp. MED121]|uniref:hypothetical protein n=1 Tax=Marinomonas sp. MED121 TaxID=314277 RepID=UPI000560CFFF|nr:hypothetical protein [Marinomonas sp. MED121]
MKNLILHFKTTWNFFIGNFGRLLKNVLPFIVFVNVIYIYGRIHFEYVGDNGVFILANTFSFLVFPMILSLIISTISSDTSINKNSLFSHYKLSLLIWVPSILLFSIISFSVACGFILLILPAFFVLARSSYAGFFLIYEREGPVTSFVSSWKATREKQWIILVGGAFIFILAKLSSNILFAVYMSQWEWTPIAGVILSSIHDFSMILIMIFAYVVYTSPQGVLKNV